jgi:hypothetical protein
MTNSDSSDFWNLNKESYQHISSESSDFWNLNKEDKSYKKYKYTSLDSIGIPNLTTDFDSYSETFSDDPDLEPEESDADLDDSDVDLEDSDTDLQDSDLQESETNLNSDQKQIPDQEQSDNLVPVPINELPPKQVVNGDKKIYDYTILEFYSSFMKNIIDIIRSLKQGKGINTLFNDKEKLLHIGIALILLSVILVPLVL